MLKNSINLIKISIDSHFKRNLIIIIFAQLIIMIIEIFFNYWHAFSFNAFMNKDVKQTLIYFIGYVIGYSIETFILVNGKYIKNKLAFYGRKKLYNFYIKKKITSNLPCQRLSQDLGQFFEIILEIAPNAFFTAIKIPIYFFIISKVAGFYIAFISIFYAVFSTIIINKFSNKLKHADYHLESEEGYLRKNLVSKFNKEENKNTNSCGLIENVERTYLDVIKQEKKLEYMQKIFYILSVLIKYSIALPLYFSGIFNYGEMARIIDGFKRLTESCSFIITNRKQIAKLDSTLERIKELN